MNFKELIQAEYNNLSKSQQLVAKTLFDKPRDFAVKSAKEIGEQIGVSETTVIRFCYSIRLTGFAELQKMVREELLFNESSLGNYLSKKLELAEQPKFYARVMEQDARDIQEMINNIKEKDFDLVVNRLVESENIWISGMGSSFSAANWATFTLGMVRQNVQLLRSETNDLLFTLSQLNSQSTLISISFHRYLKETIKVAELAKQQGAFIIGITDSPLAPIKEFADVVFYINAAEKSTIDAAPALFSLLNSIVAGVSIKDKDQFTKRKEQFEKLNVDHFFIQDGGKKN